MNRLILGLLLVCFFVTSNAQNELKGVVKDNKSGLPLAAVSIYLPDFKKNVSTNNEGVYSIKNIPSGDFLIQISLVGYGKKVEEVKIKGATIKDFSLEASTNTLKEVVVTGVIAAIDNQQTPYVISTVDNTEVLQTSATNAIDAISKVAGVSAMTNGQSISKPVIRGLGYNRVLTINDGVKQMGQVWFDEFGIEVDPNSVNRYEILKGPGSLAYGSDAIAGVINMIPEQPLPEGITKGDILLNYQTNNGLINNMLHLAGTKNGISWSARLDNTMAHAYQNPFDGYVLNSQFRNFNTDGTIGLHKKWGYTQIHASYFDMHNGIVDGTRDSASGAMERMVSYPGFNGGDPTYVLPTKQEQKSYDAFVINQRIQHTKLVWDNAIAVGEGRIQAVFSWQKNQHEESNDPTIPNTSNIYYNSTGATFDVKYISPQKAGFNFATGTNGMYQSSQSLGTLMLIPNYHFFEIGGYFIANQKIGKLNLSGGIRYDTRSFSGIDHWVDSTNQEPVLPTDPNALHEFQGFTSKFSGLSFSFGGTYHLSNNSYIKANISRGWRAPNVSECGANGGHDGTVVYEIGDNTIKPETSLEEDVTFGISSKDVGIELNLFNNNIDKFIYAQGLQSVFGGDSINNSLNSAGLGEAPVYKFTQGSAHLYGGELTLNIHPTTLPWVEFNSTLSMVDGGLSNVSINEKYLPFVPPTRITADFKFPIKQIGKSIKDAYFKIGLLSCFDQNHIYKQYSIYNGLNTALTPFEYAASNSATKGYTLFNASFGGDFVVKGKLVCKLFVICNNLLNTGYMDYMSRFKYLPVNYTSNRVGVFNMGRNVSLKLLIPINF